MTVTLFSGLEDALGCGPEQGPLYQGTLTTQRMKEMDDHARACPAAAARTIPDLAQYLGSTARTQEEGVRAICFWLHLNIQYDTRSYFSDNIRSMGAEDVLRERCAVCHGYAVLMESLCKALQLQCQVLQGYAKGLSYRPGVDSTATLTYKSNHAWLAVRLDTPNRGRGPWYFVDPTWCAGHMSGRTYVRKWAPGYYMPDPRAFMQSHYPGNLAWTLLPEAQRPTWRAFIMAARLRFPVTWELGILPRSYQRCEVPAPEDGRLSVVFQANKGACMLATVEGRESQKVYPSLLAGQDRAGGSTQLLSFTFTNLQPSSGRPEIINFFGSPMRYSTYDLVTNYAIVPHTH